MHNVVINSLRLFLRVCDLLIFLVIQELQCQDGVQKSSCVKLDRTKQTHLAMYERFLNQKWKVSFSWYVDDSKKLKWRDLTGPEKQHVFKINLYSTTIAICSTSRKNLGAVVYIFTSDEWAQQRWRRSRWFQAECKGMGKKVAQYVIQNT